MTGRSGHVWFNDCFSHFFLYIGFLSVCWLFSFGFYSKRLYCVSSKVIKYRILAIFGYFLLVNKFGIKAKDSWPLPVHMCMKMVQIGKKWVNKCSNFVHRTPKAIVQIGKMNIGSFVFVASDHKLNCCLTSHMPKSNSQPTNQTDMVLNTHKSIFHSNSFNQKNFSPIFGVITFMRYAYSTTATTTTTRHTLLLKLYAWVMLLFLIVTQKPKRSLLWTQKRRKKLCVLACVLILFSLV